MSSSAFAFAAGSAALAAAKSAARKESGEGLSGKKGRAAFAWTTGLFTAVLTVAGVCVGQSDPASRVILKEGVAIPGGRDKVLPTLTFSEPRRADSAEYRLQKPGQTAIPVWRCSFPVPGLSNVGPTSIESRIPSCHAAFLDNRGGRTFHSGFTWLSLDLAIPNSQRGDWWSPDPTDRTGPTGPSVRIKGDLILHNATVIQRDVTTFMEGAEAIVSWPGQEMRITRDGQVRSRIWAPPPFLGGTDSIFRNNYMLWNGNWICEFSLYPEDGPRPFFRDYRQHPRKPTFKPYGLLPPNTPTFKPHCQLPAGAILVNEKGIELPPQKFAPEDLKFSGSISLCAPLDPVVWHLDFELLLPPPSTPP